jgi:hypothetical protein
MINTPQKSPIQFREITNKDHMDLTMKGVKPDDYVRVDSVGVNVEMMMIQNRAAQATLPSGDGGQMQTLVFQITVPIPIKRNVLYGRGLITPDGVNNELQKAIPMPPEISIVMEKSAIINACQKFIPKEESTEG